VIVGGRVRAGFAVKIYVRPGRYGIVLCGTVRDVTYRRRADVSILHVEAVQPSPIMRNRILSYVYGIFEEHGANDGVRPHLLEQEQSSDGSVVGAEVRDTEKKHNFNESDEDDEISGENNV
jgi:hypothetical protein